MSRAIFARLFAVALLGVAVMAASAFAPQPAMAQGYDDQHSDVSFDMFYNRLEPYGRWFESDRWGYVWQPEDVGDDFRPYYEGHWVNTERYGWYWVSDEVWGDIVYHYGRWVYDRDDGWLWVPGYVWAPAWVIWREGEGSTGWMPMPPDENFLSGDESWHDNWAADADDYYGYENWYGPTFAATFFSLWLFVDDDHFGDHHFHRYVRRHHHRDHDRWRAFFHRTHDATRYSRFDDYVVNRGVDPDALRRRTGRHFKPVPLRDVMRRGALAPTRIDRGHRIRRREIEQRPDFTPRWLRQGQKLRAPGTRERFPARNAKPARSKTRPQTRPADRRRQELQRQDPRGQDRRGQNRRFQPNAAKPRVNVIRPAAPPRAPAVTPPKAPTRPAAKQPGFARPGFVAPGHRRKLPAVQAPARPASTRPASRRAPPPARRSKSEEKPPAAYPPPPQRGRSQQDRAPQDQPHRREHRYRH